MKNSKHPSKKSKRKERLGLFNNQWLSLGLAVMFALSVVFKDSVWQSEWHWLQRFVLWDLKIAAVLVAFILLIQLVVFVLEKRLDEPTAGTVAELRRYFIMALPLAIAWWVDSYSHSVLPFLTRIFGLYGMRSVVFCGTVGFGIIAHLWKRKDQLTYGMGEVLFACLATGYIAFRILPGQSVLSQWVALGGGAYVVARGLNNMVDAKNRGTALVAGR